MEELVKSDELPEIKCSVCNSDLVWSHAEGTPIFVLPCMACREIAIDSTWNAARRLYDRGAA